MNPLFCLAKQGERRVLDNRERAIMPLGEKMLLALRVVAENA